MRLRLFIPLVLVILFAAACQGPPPTMYVLVVTSTSESATAESATGGTPEAPQATPEDTATPEPTPTTDPFPTPVVNQVYVAEQRFENGRMFWLDAVGQIWIILETDNGSGPWRVYDDNFVEGQLELDPAIETEVPEEFQQPVRGFGKLWRENPEVREALGWALELEFGHVTRYEYHAGGEVDEQNEYVFGVGYHLLVSLYGETIRFDEETWTWEIDN